nr:LRR receptor-like serine/threonine-protein kinase FLS2 [Aegilops tauschii subsp. strangulata]
MSFVDLSFVRDWVHTVNMLPSLKVLCLHECDLNSTVPASNLHSNSNLSHLEVLVMSENNFYTSLKHNWFWNLTSLKELYLSFCGWNGSVPSELGNMMSLQVIDLRWNNLESLLPRNLENLCDLEVSAFDFNNINTSMSEFMDRLPMCSWNTLQELSVQYTNMTGNLPVWIRNMTNLSVLRASGNMMAGPLPVGVRALGNLKELDLGYNNFNGVLLKDHFTSLGYNNFSAVLLREHFTSLGNLKFLDLSYNNFSGVLLREHFPSFCNLEWLDISYNNFNSVLLKEHFESLRNLKLSDLGCKNFSGALSSDLKAPFLEELLLSNKQIGGMIPSSLCRLASLQRLDLPGNKFTGDVMQCFKEFGANSTNQFGSQMLSLALNNNDLSGAIPSGPQLQTLDNQMYIYMANPGLCGPPLSKNCSANDAKQSSLEDINHVSSVYLVTSIGFVVGLW